MQDTDIVRGYALLGLVAFIEDMVAAMKAGGREPSMVIVGQIEWLAIMDCKPSDDYEIAGVKVVPDLEIRHLVSVQ